MSDETVPVVGLYRIRDLVPLIRVGSVLNEQRVSRAAAIIDVDGRDFVEVYTGSDDPTVAYCRWLYRADMTINLTPPEQQG